MAVIVLLGLVVCFFYKELFLGVIISNRDLWQYFYPLWNFTVQSMKSGHIPLWNPYLYSGHPHLASLETHVFYPPSIILYLMPFDRAFTVVLVFHVFLAGVGVYFFAREWGLKISSSLVAAITFMFGGYLVSTIAVANTLCSVAWFPVAFTFFAKALKGDTRSALLTSVTLCLMFLGGDPSVYYSAAWIFFFYALWRVVTEPAGLRSRPNAVAHTGTVLITVFAVSLLLMSFQLFPFLELATRSYRVSMDSIWKTFQSLPLKDCADLLFPGFFEKNFSVKTYFSTQLWLESVYVGAFSVFLGIAALFGRRRKEAIFLVLLSALSIVLALGKNTPVYGLLFKIVPGLSLIRFPIRFFFIGSFCLAVLSGAGYDAYLDRLDDARAARPRRTRWLIITALLASLAALVLATWFWPAFRRARGCLLFRPGLNCGLDMRALSPEGFVNLIRFMIFFSIGSLIAWLGAQRNTRRILAHSAFISLIFLDFFTMTSGIHGTSDSATFRAATPNIEYLTRDKSLFRFHVSPKTLSERAFLPEEDVYLERLRDKDSLWGNWPMVHHLYSTQGYDPLELKDYLEFVNIISTSSRPSETNLLNLLNVKYIITTGDLNDDRFSLVNVSFARIYENRDVLPRAFLVRDFTVCAREADMARRLQSKDFDPRDELLLEAPPPFAEDGRAQRNAPQDRVEIVQYSPDEILIDAAVAAPQFLVMSEQYYPGWKAFIDGRSATLYKANRIMRAVYLMTPGHHRIRFIFSPFSFKLGSAISMITGLAVMILIARNGRRRAGQGV